MKKLLFVYNPHSGKGEIGQSLSDIICTFTGSGYNVAVHPTSAALDGQNFIAECAGEYDMIVSSGGDGMLHELFCGLIASGKSVPCGYIPSGTVNDFASSMKIPKEPVKAAETVVAGNFQEIDAGVFGGNIFSYVAAFGMFTKVSYATDQRMKNVLGAAAYLIEILRSMDIKHFYESTVHAKVIMNGEEYEDDFIFGMAGNTFSVGGLSNLVPNDAEMDDGLLDCMFIRTPKTIPDLERIKIALINQSLDIPGIITGKTDKLTVISEKPIQWTLDGENGGETTNVDIGIRNKAIRIAVPK